MARKALPRQNILALLQRRKNLAMKKSYVVGGLLLAFASVALAGCGTTKSASGSAEATGNAAKPVVFFNRQPSNPTTGAIDMDTMNFNDKTLYVGFDAAGGGAIQGKLITDYIASKNAADLDRNSDGSIGYVLCIGDVSHNDSIARTTGIRKALGTWNTSASPSDHKEGSATTKDGKTLKVVELAAKEMKSTAGATWDAATAGDTFGTWATQYSTQIDIVVSNNDGMAMGCLGAADYPAGVPAFGYDANADAVQSIIDGTGKTGAYLTGTVSQNAGAQAFMTLQTLRNALDGATGDKIHTLGITEADAQGNKQTAESIWEKETKALKALNVPVTSANASAYLGIKMDTGIKQYPSTLATKKVLLSLYNSSDNFLSGTYKPYLKAYAALLNINLQIVEGDGQNEQNCLDKFTNLDSYDAYAINLVRTNDGASYTDLLKA
jgi:methyl-galactoside transport system substrate-binding protein